MELIDTSGDRATMKLYRQDNAEKLQGRTVNVALADGSVLDRVPLMLARRNTLWVVRDGEDVFLPLDRVVNIWDAPPFRVASRSADDGGERFGARAAAGTRAVMTA